MPAWATPNDFATGHVVTAADWNNFMGTNGDLAFLFGDIGWTNVPAFTNSWAASGTAPGYILIGRTVWLRGAMSAGTANTAAFTLPAGYRPSQTVNVLVNNGAASANLLTVNTTGTVVPLNSATVWLNAVSFPNV